MPANEPLRVLRVRQVCARVGLSRSTIYLLEAQGKFPRHVPLGENSVGWVEAEVEAWLRSRVAARDSAAKEAEPCAA